MLRMKRRKLSEISDERTFREDVLRILFQKMGFKGVEVLHGSNEHGKDLVFHQINEITDKKTNYAVVAKVGKITGGTGNAPEHLINIKRQIELCLDIPYKDVTEKRDVFIEKVWVINNSTISDPAKTQILESFNDRMGLIGRNVDFIPESKLIEWLDNFWPEFFRDGDPFILEYCASLKEKYETLIELKSIGYNKKARELLDVFIEPTLVETKRDPGPKGKLNSFIERSLSEIITDSNSYWITGSLGSGKSTLLRMQILNLIKEIASGSSSYAIPLAFRFCELFNDDGVTELDELITTTIHNHNVFQHNISPDEWLAEGKCIVFLDGYDEVHSYKHSADILDKVSRFMLKYPQVKVIATSREKGIDLIEAKLNKFHKLEIHPMSYKQMLQFIMRWFNERGPERQAMQDVIKRTVLANTLPKTPMVMTLLAILVDEKETKELPANMTELYSSFTQLFLGRWDSIRDINTIYDYNLKSNVLMALAYSMHADGRDKISRDAIIEFIEDYTAKRGIDIDSNLLLNELTNRSNLIYVDDKDFVAFKHLSFQQYFTSLRWEQMTYSTSDVLKNALDIWWSPVIFFFVGKKKDAPDIIKGLIDIATNNPYDDVKKILGLGQLLQAAYLTNLNIKKDALIFAINSYCDNMPNVLQEVNKGETGRKQKISEVLLMLVMKSLFETSYTSATLERAFKEVYEEINKTSQTTDKYSFMKPYVIAYILAILDDKEHYNNLAKAPATYDPMFSLLMEIDVAVMDKDYGIKFDQKTIDKIKKRIRRHGKYLRKLIEESTSQKSIPDMSR